MDEVFVAVCHDLGDGGEAAVVDDAVVVDVPEVVAGFGGGVHDFPFVGCLCL